MKKKRTKTIFSLTAALVIIVALFFFAILSH